MIMQDVRISQRFWDMRPHGPSNVNPFSEEHFPSIFRVTCLILLFFGPEDGGDMFFQNVI
jgi:hypothetical protein